MRTTTKLLIAFLAAVAVIGAWRWGSPMDSRTWSEPHRTSEPESGNVEKQSLEGMPSDATREALVASGRINLVVVTTCSGGPFNIRLLSQPDRACLDTKRVQSQQETPYDLPTGSYLVEITARGWARTEQDITIASGENRTLPIDVYPLHAAYGTAIDADTGTGLRDFRVCLESVYWDGESEAVPLPECSDVESTTGEFCLCLPVESPLRCRATVEAAGYESGSTEWVPFMGEDSVALPTISLSPVDREDQGAAMIHGRVVDDETGEPLGGATVGLKIVRADSGAPRAIDAQGYPLRSGETEQHPVALSDESGMFALAYSGQEAAVRLTVRQDDYCPFESEVFFLAIGDQVRDYVVRLERGARIFGTVFLAEGNSVQVRKVSMTRGGAATTVDLSVPDGSTVGRFEFRGVPAGLQDIALLASPPKGIFNADDVLVEIVQKTVAITDAGDYAVEFYLEAGATGVSVQGSVLLPVNEGSCDCVVNLFRGEDGKFFRRTWLGQDSASFGFQNVQEGRFLLTAYARGQNFVALGAQELLVGNVDLLDVQIDLAEMRAIVMASGEEPQALVELVAQGFEGALGRVLGQGIPMAVPEKGVLHLYGLPQGRYHVSGIGGDGAVDLVVRQGSVSEVLLQSSPSARTR